jgi:hypothetical protein
MIIALKKLSTAFLLHHLALFFTKPDGTGVNSVIKISMRKTLFQTMDIRAAPIPYYPFLIP